MSCIFNFIAQVIILSGTFNFMVHLINCMYLFHFVVIHIIIFTVLLFPFQVYIIYSLLINFVVCNYFWQIPYCITLTSPAKI